MRWFQRWGLLLLTFAGCGGGAPSGGTGVIVPTCNGSGLVGDLSGQPTCTPPASPKNNCTTPVFSLRRGQNPQGLTDGFFEAETAVAIDPRPNVQLAYAATIQATVAPANPVSTYPTRSCIVQKRIRVYMSTDGGVSWTEMAGNDDLLTSATPADPQTGLNGFWATDPDVSVGGDGTLYLSFVKLNANPICQIGTAATTDPQASVQLWFAPPGGKLQPALPTPAGFSGMNPAVTFKPTTRDGPLDHPKLAASPTPGVVSVYHIDSGDGDQIVTFRRQGSTFVEANRMFVKDPNGNLLINRFFALAFDPGGDLYVVGDTTLAQGPRSVVRYRLQANNQWLQVTAAHVPLTNTLVGAFGLPSHPGQLSVLFAGDATPTVAISTLGETSDAIIYVASLTVDNMLVRHLEIAAANTNNLSAWLGPVEIDRPQGTFGLFAPHISVAGASNFLDIISHSLHLRPGAPPPPTPPEGLPVEVPFGDLVINAVLYRFDAARLFTPGTTSASWLLSGPTAVNEVPLPVQVLPARNSPSATSLFSGEYLGIASKGRNPIFTWPNMRPGIEFPPATAIDLGIATQTDVCPTAMTWADPDTMWDCDCTCTGKATRVRGCGKGNLTTASQVCGAICQFLPCPSTHFTCAPAACTSNGTGRIISQHSCTVGEFPPAGGAPSTRADFAASDSGTSQATLTVGGSQSTTHLSGGVFINASTSPPAFGTGLEIGMLDLQPADVALGGSVNALVRNIKLAERMKIRGVFTDATHFRIDPGFIDLMIALQTEASEGDLSDPINVRASNAAPFTGELNLTAGTVSLDGTAADGAGNSMDIHFRGAINSRPPDSDHDGIIDAVDKCPGATIGPDRTAPLFTFVPPAITTSSCSAINIGQAQASDSCGVTVSNDAPARFPIGTTLVRWTARDGAGNTTVVTQMVTVSLGDDPSCCPTGSHIIVGTSNNDTLTGTSGADCIIGRGGQDTINGGGGNDFISGGDGDDVLNGQDGDDVIFGGSGQDRPSGGAGNDTLYGGDGTDIVNGDDGNDTLYGGEGQDTLNGGAGNDVIIGGVGDDVISGGVGNDFCAGGAGNDRVNGDGGDDKLFGDEGDDRIDGSSGQNFLDGGGGHDTCMDNGMTLAECPEHETS